MELNISVVEFENGLFFSGVKGKSVRETKCILDAKRLEKGILSERDRCYLEDTYQRRPYKIVNLKIIITKED